jgi:putative hydrolase of the HAD superfamily
MLDIEADFEEIHIVDPETSNQTKRDVFADIMSRHNYTPADVLVIGDDPESEIKAAIELGIDTFLFDPGNMHPDAVVTYRAGYLNDVLKYV